MIDSQSLTEKQITSIIRSLLNTGGESKLREGELITVEGACRLLKVSRWTIRRMCKKGLIKYIKLSSAKSGSVRIFRDSLIAYISQL